MDLTHQLIILGRATVAMFLGGLIGLERELEDKPAGLRTHMIIATASCLLIGISDIIIKFYSESSFSGSLRIDPMRALQAIIMGVCILAGGAILRDKNERTVRGLTTVVSFLLSSAIGLSAGTGQYILAVGTTILGIIMLLFFQLIEKIIKKHFTRRSKNENTD